MRIIEILDYINISDHNASRAIADHFEISVGDASVRINKLHKSGLIKRLPDIYPYQYEITEFGKRYLKYKQENPGKRLQWHGLIPKDKR